MVLFVCFGEGALLVVGEVDFFVGGAVGVEEVDGEGVVGGYDEGAGVDGVLEGFLEDGDFVVFLLGGCAEEDFFLFF